MAHIGRAADMADISDLITAMLTVGKGRPVAEVAQAALSIALGLYASDTHITRDMVMEVITSQVDATFRMRSN